MKTIVIIAATPLELSLLIRQTGAIEGAVKGIPSVHHVRSGNRKIILAVSGMGKVNAAASAAALITIFAPDYLINTGCAGAYAGSGLSIGDITLATSEFYAEEGVVTPTGWQPVQVIGIPLAESGGKLYYNEIPLSVTDADTARAIADSIGIRLHSGKFVTVSGCSGTTARGVELSSRFGAICENMEGAAVAHVALRYSIPCTEIRGISNKVEDRDLSCWDIATAAENAQRFLLRFIDAI